MVDTDAYPYSSIVLIDSNINGQWYRGSGVMIAPNEVLTASHVVWSAGAGVATEIYVAPGYDGTSAPLGVYSGVATHYHPVDNTGGTLTFNDVQRDYALIHLSEPTNAGVMQLGADYDKGSAFVSGYPLSSGAAQVNDKQEPGSVSTLAIYTTSGLGVGSSGGPIWTMEDGGATVVGTVSGESDGGAGYNMKLTAQSRATIQSWLAEDSLISPVVGYSDVTAGTSGLIDLAAASGGPSYLDWQYIWSGPGDVAMSTSMPNTFLHGGSGQDALQVTSGQNVLDGGKGSNFLTGGVGNDTFFTDARGSAPVWTTIQNFNVGDGATLWGFDPAVSSYWWEDGVDGAPGHTGATLRANIVGGAGRSGDGIDASVTFAGMSVTQARSMQVTTGTQEAGSYLYFSGIGA